MFVYEFGQRLLRAVARARPGGSDPRPWSRSGCGCCSSSPGRSTGSASPSLVVLVAMGVGAFTIPFVADFFLLEIPPAEYAVWIAGTVAVGCVLISIGLHLVGVRVPIRPPSRPARVRSQTADVRCPTHARTAPARVPPRVAGSDPPGSRRDGPRLRVRAGRRRDRRRCRSGRRPSRRRRRRRCRRAC